MFNLPLLSCHYCMCSRFSVCDVLWQRVETHFIAIAMNAFFSLLFLNTRLYNSFITKRYPHIKILVIIGNKRKIIIPINQGVTEWRSFSPVLFNDMVQENGEIIIWRVLYRSHSYKFSFVFH